MSHPRLENINIESVLPLPTPREIKADLPLTAAAIATVAAGRETLEHILDGDDPRLFAVVGPCSIHNLAAAEEYARRLKQLADEIADTVFVVMRVYFEKPRSSIGWKGLINDPDLDQTFRINKGLRLARHLLVDINEMGMPAATEYLDLNTPQYVNDLISWGAIGARTTESQVHRELASGLSCPVGFKNGTDGNVRIAIDAIRSSSRPHRFLSYTKAGHSAIFATRGNEDTHIILRGGRKPNYDRAAVEDASQQLRKAGVRDQVMIDFSHANSAKDPRVQITVAEDVARQIAAGDRRIIGVMIESHLVGGRQDVVPGQPLVYGQSITDACLAWDETVPVLETLARAVRERREG